MNKNFRYIAFSYIECSMEKLLHGIHKIWGNEKFSISTGVGVQDMDKIEQFHGGNHFEIIVFFQISSGCIMISNYADGMDSMTYILSAELKINIFNFRISSDNCQYPVNSLCYIVDGTLVRAIYALKENKWSFYNVGEPLWFESVDKYQNRIINKRMNESILMEYCAKLELNIDNKNFWNNNNAVVVKRLKW